MPLSNLKKLRQDMIEKNWTICSFLFSYNLVEYIVLVKRLIDAPKASRKNKYVLVKLHFMKSNDLNNELEVMGNSRGLIVDAKILREYFGIIYRDNLGDILQQFNKNLGKAIPTSISENISEKEKNAMIKSLSMSDSESPYKIYCYKVKRNSNSGKRSNFNSDKTKLLRPALFKHFENDSSISFCYSDNPEQENDDSTILRNFSKSSN